MFKKLLLVSALLISQVSFLTEANAHQYSIVFCGDRQQIGFRGTGITIGIQCLWLDENNNEGTCKLTWDEDWSTGKQCNSSLANQCAGYGLPTPANWGQCN
jgi:hypothetical protein